MKLTLSLLLIFSFISLSAQDFKAGKETDLDWPDTVNKKIKVYLPENYDYEKKWPVIFLFHGMNGTPDTKVLQRYTGKKDFIIVAMDYFIKGTQKFKTVKEGQKYYFKEYQNVVKAKDFIAKHVSIDDKKLFLAGISKGGWIAGVVSETQLSSFAGTMIFLAGKNVGKKRPIKIPNRSGIPIYVGVGEFDGNLIPGVAAAPHFKSIRANVTFEIFDDTGHSLPKKTPPLLTEWLNLQRPAAEVNQVEWFKSKIEAFKVDDPKELLKAYRDIREHPLVFKTTREQQQLFSSVLKKKFSTVKEFLSEYNAYREYHKILLEETKAGKPSDWEKVINDLKNLQKKYPATEYAGRCDLQIKRATKVWELCKDHFEKMKSQRGRIGR